MSEVTKQLAKRLRASVRHGAPHGDVHERSICERQMLEAAAALEVMGGPSAAQLDALRAENARLRKALEAAPTFYTNCREQDAFEFKYPHWYDTTRREAIDG